MDFVTVILTRNSAPWIVSFLQAYRKLGIEPLYIVDARSTDNTRALLTQHGADSKSYLGLAKCIEDGIIEFASSVMPTSIEWTLRIDDDEMPSAPLIRWLKDAELSSHHMWAISRREVIKSDNRLLYSRYWSQYHTPDRPEYLNAQVRFYKHKSVRFDKSIHTPGFELDDMGFVPQNTPFYHFDAVLRTFRQRLDKIISYDSNYPSSSFRYVAHYLPEIVPLAEHRALQVPIDDLDSSLMRHMIDRITEETVNLTLNELQLIGLNALDRGVEARKAEYQLWCEQQQKENSESGPIFTNQALGELLCTIGSLLERAQVNRRFTDELKYIGARWQIR